MAVADSRRAASNAEPESFGPFAGPEGFDSNVEQTQFCRFVLRKAFYPGAKRKALAPAQDDWPGPAESGLHPSDYWELQTAASPANYSSDGFVGTIAGSQSRLRVWRMQPLRDELRS